MPRAASRRSGAPVHQKTHGTNTCNSFNKFLRFPHSAALYVRLHQHVGDVCASDWELPTEECRAALPDSGERNVRDRRRVAG